MVTAHDDLATLPGAPSPYEMAGLDCTIIMHPQVWKVSGHYDLFHDWMVDCKSCNSRFRTDQVMVKVVVAPDQSALACETYEFDAVAGMGLSSKKTRRLEQVEFRHHKDHPSDVLEQIDVTLEAYNKGAVRDAGSDDPEKQAKCPKCDGPLTAPREFNLMFETHTGAVRSDDTKAFLRPETAQGIFCNYKNVVDSSRVKIPFGIAQVGKSFRNEITPRNFTFRSREFEQMEIEFFCKPETSPEWYKFWRDRRYQWYLNLGLARERLRLRDHHKEELSHYSCGTADIEYAFPFLAAGEFGELEGIAHRGDFDLRSHMEGKLAKEGDSLIVEKGPDGKPKYKGSGKDLTYFDEAARERFLPHVIEPSAGADRATLAFLCEAYQEEEVKGDVRVVLKLHPRIAPFKAAIFPLVNKDGMPDVAQKVYRDLKKSFPVFYDDKGAVGRRYRRQDEAGTPYCVTVDGQTLTDQTVTIRDRDTLVQERVAIAELEAVIRGRMQP
jgi:glycyl-tRNA synthetase